MERILFLPVWLASADRKDEIFRLIRRGPAEGMIAVAFHEAGSDSGDLKSVGRVWKYQNGTQSGQIATVIEDLDRHIARAYERRDLVYRGATVRAFS